MHAGYHFSDMHQYKNGLAILTDCNQKGQKKAPSIKPTAQLRKVVDDRFRIKGK